MLYLLCFWIYFLQEMSPLIMIYYCMRQISWNVIIMNPLCLFGISFKETNKKKWESLCFLTHLRYSTCLKDNNMTVLLLQLCVPMNTAQFIQSLFRSSFIKSNCYKAFVVFCTLHFLHGYTEMFILQRNFEQNQQATKMLWFYNP